MPPNFERNLNLCFTKFKRHQSPPPLNHRRCHSKSTLTKTFNTLYDIPPDSEDSGASTAADFSTVVASDRFFFSSPGRSNSIIESSSSHSASSSSFSPETDPAAGFETLGGGGVAIPTISPDPYFDFRKSMQEMVEARDHFIDARANWDYLHELLTCYLDLNPKSAHKFIVAAFADLVVSLMADTGGGGRNNNNNNNI